MLQRELDEGEAEAIALGLQVEADWLLLDEREGRRVAKSLSLKVTGTLGILLRAKYAGQLESMREAGATTATVRFQGWTPVVRGVSGEGG